MKWPWTKSTDRRDGPNPEKARADLERIRAQWPEVQELAATLREDRRRNHYGEHVARLFGEKP